MPIELTWHPQLPVLIVTYSGDLTIADYRAMVRDRAKLLAHVTQPVILLADVRGLGRFEDAAKVPPGEHVLCHESVVCTLVVVNQDTYDRWARAILQGTARYRVLFFWSMDSALASAQSVLTA